MRPLAKWSLVLALLVIALLPLSNSYAQGTPTVSDDQVNQVASQMYCPVCENVPLDVCPTKACAQWRELIREKIASGWSTQQIMDYFVAQYGDQVLGVPPQRGLNWLIYVFPPLMLVAIIFVVVRVVRGSNKSSPLTKGQSPGKNTIPTEGIINEIERDLQRKE